MKRPSSAEPSPMSPWTARSKTAAYGKKYPEKDKAHAYDVHMQRESRRGSFEAGRGFDAKPVIIDEDDNEVMEDDTYPPDWYRR